MENDIKYALGQRIYHSKRSDGVADPRAHPEDILIEYDRFCEYIVDEYWKQRESS